MRTLKKPTICVFVKEPRPGFAKTRLAPAVGERGAAALATAFFEDTVAMLEQRAWARIVLVVDGDPAGLPTRAGVEVWPQGEGDLGARLERALRRALERSPAALAIGADSPDLPGWLIDHGGVALEECDAVVGPAHDGGFYLLGLRRCPEGLLADLPWSAPDTRAHVTSRLVRHGFSVETLEAWHDIDDADGLARLRQRLTSRPTTARATAMLLQVPQRADI